MKFSPDGKVRSPFSTGYIDYLDQPTKVPCRKPLQAWYGSIKRTTAQINQSVDELVTVTAAHNGA
jgi:hypothetical protein